MAQRIRQTLFAALAASLVAFLAMGLTLYVVDGAFPPVAMQARAALAAGIATLPCWWWGFPNHSGGLLRAAIIGLLIVIIAMFVLILSLVPVAVDFEHFMAVALIVLISLWLFGPILIPVGIVAAVLIRWLQLRGKPLAPNSKPE